MVSLLSLLVSLVPVFWCLSLDLDLVEVVVVDVAVVAADAVEGVLMRMSEAVEEWRNLLLSSGGGGCTALGSSFELLQLFRRPILRVVDAVSFTVTAAVAKDDDDDDDSFVSIFKW